MGNSNGFDTPKARTTDATAAILWNRTVNASDCFHLSICVMGRKPDASQVACFRRLLTVHNGGAGAQFDGAAIAIMPDVNTAGWTLTIQLDGNELQVLVTGAAATTVDWSSRIEVLLD